MYKVKSYAGHNHERVSFGVLLSMTAHGTEAEKDEEVKKWRDLIASGVVSKIEVLQQVPPFRLETITSAA